MSDIRDKFESLQIETTAIVWDGEQYQPTGGKYAEGVALAANFGFAGFKQGYEFRQEEIDALKAENERLKAMIENVRGK